MRIRRLLGYRQGTVASQMGAVAVLGAVLLSAGVFAVRSALGQNSEAPGFRRSAAFLSVAAQSRAAGTLSGVVTDPTGALVPRATVDASDTATGQRETQQTGNDGRFRFGLPGGSYLVEVYARGFQPAIRENVAVNSDTAPELSFRLAVGAVSQELKVSAARSSAAPPAGSGRGAGAPVMVSGATMAGNAVHQPPPLYPAEAKEKHIQGTVVLQATISKTGEVENLRVVSGPEELQSSALDAVRQWQYKPYLLNGEPVAVSTTIRVNYTLGPDGPPAATQGAPGASVQGAGRPLRVSAGVMAGQVIQQTPPEYPAEAKSKGIQGVVVLRARISKEGNVEDLQVESGPDELRQSAIDAVKQWTYKPFLLNGEPVAVDTTIHVNYTLAPS